MQDNAFYKGVLFELEKLAVNAAPPTTPTIKPPTPAPSVTPASPAPTQPASTTPFQLGNIKLAPREQNIVHDVTSNRELYQPYLQRGEQYMKSLPNLSSYNQSDLQKQMFDTGQTSVINKGIAGFGENGVFGGIKGLVNGYQDTDKVKQTFEGFRNSTPENQLEMINEIAAKDPHLAKFLQAQVQRATTEHVNNEGFGDIAKDVWHGITGQENQGKPNGTASYTDVLMRDQNVKNFAKDALMGRAGKLTGEFLKNNWKILSSVIGGTGLVALVYSLMKNSGQEQQNVQQYNKPPGPRFL